MQAAMPPAWWGVDALVSRCAGIFPCPIASSRTPSPLLLLLLLLLLLVPQPWPWLLHVPGVLSLPLMW